MRSINVGLYTLGFSTAAALLTACGGAQPPISAAGEMPQKMRPASSSSFQVLYQFGHYPKGFHPLARLTDVDGTLYGTTSRGGDAPCAQKHGCGTVYSLSTAGAEKVLHSFGGGPDGATPLAGLINVNGTLYGTTYVGGNSVCKLSGFAPGCGTVYSISRTGAEKVLYRFAGGGDGAYPPAELTEVNGMLYGTTSRGGTGCRCCGGCGIVFSISPSGIKRTLHKFKGSPDGAGPAGGLLNVNGTLYGTTGGGGAGGGTVYSISTHGLERVLYRFQGRADGVGPNGGLTDIDGTLYGTTYGSLSALGNVGTVYSVTTSGKHKVLYSFNKYGDADFQDSLTAMDGMLYGEIGSVVYRLSTNGLYELLYTFVGTDSGAPSSGLLGVKGTLYGTTEFGGDKVDCRRCGTVFELTP